MKGIHNHLFAKIFCNLLFLIGLLMSGTAFAANIVVAPNTVIDQPTTYTNSTLDMTNGSFIIKNHATLTLSNCTVQGILSPINPVLFNVEAGSINFQNNIVNVQAVNIPPHPQTQALQYVMQIGLGSVNLKGNSFKIEQPYAAGLLITSSSVYTKDFQITDNTFQNFHGVLYLINSDNAFVARNTLLTNSYGNIVMIGNHSKIQNNLIMFSGSNQLGNSIDLLNSSDITVSDNQLLTPTCHGIYIINSHDVSIDSNKISGGITYAINVYTYPEASVPSYLSALMSVRKSNLISNHVSITNNYMAQNRYGVAASDVDNLVVSNNYFIQRFTTDEARQFWTNNDILLKNVTNLTWTNNLYKEAFTQEIDGDNTRTKQFVPFPVSGGVKLTLAH